MSKEIYILIDKSGKVRGASTEMATAIAEKERAPFGVTERGSSMLNIFDD